VIFKFDKSIFSKIMFLINIIIGFLHSICLLFNNFYLEYFSNFSLISVFFPVIYALNLFFLLYWLVKLDYRFIFSSIFLLLSFDISFYKYDNDNNISSENEIHLMSFNVRLFNHYNWIKSDSIAEKISEFSKVNSPDVLSLQEFHNDYKYLFNHYKNSHFGLNGENVGLALFSNKKIVKKGNIDDQYGKILAIFIDVVSQNDTVRIYNSHLKSYNFDLVSLKMDKKSLKKVLERSKHVYEIQNKQIDYLISNVNQNEMPSVISVDLNSTPYSFVYKKISNHFNDSFLKKGRGFGSTYGLGKIPMRIDFMFTTPSISVNNFVKHNINLSDHKPISVFLKI